MNGVAWPTFKILSHLKYIGNGWRYMRFNFFTLIFRLGNTIFLIFDVLVVSTRVVLTHLFKLLSFSIYHNNTCSENQTISYCIVAHIKILIWLQDCKSLPMPPQFLKCARLNNNSVVTVGRTALYFLVLPVTVWHLKQRKLSKTAKKSFKTAKIIKCDIS